MYQFIVLGIAGALVVGGSYYIVQSDNQGVLATSFTAPIQTEGLPTMEDVAGVYICMNDAGCNRPYTLTLSEDGAARMEVSYDASGVEVLQESGIWGFKPGGLIALTFTGSGAETYDPPHSFLIQSVSPHVLSKYVFDETKYPDMVKPVFTRQF
jgi:hypothetical protein